MQRVGAIVDIQLVDFPINFKMTIGDAVGIASWHFSCTWAVVEVVGHILVAEYHVGEISLTIGNLNAHNARTHCRERHTGSRLVDKAVDGDFALRRIDGFDKCFHASHLCAPSLMMTG